jgi:Uncharacterized protein conserved in bacteria (DUF2252)
MAVKEAVPRYGRINYPSLDERLDQDGFDRSVTEFCERYADQNERDYAEFVRAVRSGRLEAVEGV